MAICRAGLQRRRRARGLRRRLAPGRAAGGATGLARFNGGAALIACGRCGDEADRHLAARGDSGLALTDYAALERRPGAGRRFEHVVLVDPPPSAAREAAAGAATGGRQGDPGFLHPAWGRAEREFALAVLDEQLGLAGRGAAPSGPARGGRRPSGGALREALARRRRHPLAPRRRRAACGSS